MFSDLGLSQDRRQMLGSTASALVAASLPSVLVADETAPIGNLHLARFRFDVTPPLGHSLCGGWIKPVLAVDDPLEAIGFVLLGAGKPIVICAVDWTGILNSAHAKWRQTLADAAGTTADRVAVHCVHQHNAPFACLDAERLVDQQGDLPHVVDGDFFQGCLDRAHAAVRDAISQSIAVTHVASGQATVDRVASNRRILGLNGKVLSQRGSSSTDPLHHRFPEGLIDPMLKTVGWYDGDRMLAACHYYACHPMSYYGDGRVSADFCGLARKQLQQQQPDCLHLYMNGCGGNIGAGKYNNGSPPMRPVLTKRILDAMIASQRTLERQSIESLAWHTHDILPPVLPELDEDALRRQMENRSESNVNRSRPSFALAWIERVRAGLPITLSGLHVNDISLLHLPAECFVEYQLRAQASAADRFVACAAYGDGGPWYIPTADAYPQGGYAVGVAWCAPAVDQILSDGIQRLLMTE